MKLPAVAAVIVTTGRDSVVRAIESALGQVAPVDVYVVVDTDDPSVAPAIANRYPTVQVLQSTARNAAANRNRGAVAAFESHDFVAFLDDDDWWDPSWVQVAIERGALGARVNSQVLITGSVLFHRRNARIQVRPRGPMPQEPKRAFDEVLRRRAIAQASSFLQSSTMIVSRGLFESAQWNSSIGRHEDWQFFHDAAIRGSTTWVHVQTPLVHVVQGSAGSISSRVAWRTSYDWLKGLNPAPSRDAQADFLVAQVLRDALTAGDGRGIAMVGKELRALRRFGRLYAWFVAAASALRRQSIKASLNPLHIRLSRGQQAKGVPYSSKSHDAADALSQELARRLRVGDALAVTWFNHHSLMQVMKQGAGALTHIDVVGVDGLLLLKLLRGRRRTSADLVVPRLLECLPDARVFVLGGHPTALHDHEAAITNLLNETGRVVGNLDGYEGRPSTEAFREAVRDTDANLVLVGLGAALQEAYVGAAKLGFKGAGLALTVGGFLDQASMRDYYPAWAYRFRLNWLVRLAREPKRLWRRYLFESLQAAARRRRLRDFIESAARGRSIARY